MSTMFDYVKFDARAHMAIIKIWFEDRGFPVPNPRYLPPTGYLVTAHGYPVCAGFLFKTDAKIASISHLISDFDAAFEIRSEALDFLLDRLEKDATLAGFEILSCATNLDRLMGRFKNLGFNKMDENVSHFGKEISCQVC